ncbi:MAG: GIY-YIG nuclease family protein [Peptostreptococcaceae bacterium]|nr:GIY-YIG nuclease family protein [Peptostreptococcaceae bacterium]
MYYTYILQCSDGTLYTGYAVDINQRVAAHNSGKGSKYTRGRLPVTLVYYEVLDTKKEALQRERQIKKLDRIGKIKLIQAETWD